MAFDPFTTVDQPAQCSQWAVYRDAEGALNRVHGTHLISNRTDSADPSGNIWNLTKTATTKEGFKKTRRLKDFQLDVDHIAVADLDIEPAFAFDPRQIVNLDRLSFHAPRFPGGTVRHMH